MIQEYPLLSVIVPVYNTERFLRKCLDSLLNETYPNMEIIVVNDNSPDGSQKIIDEYMEQYPNIRCVINKENQGLFHARLRGYEIATGEYICSVDSDDYVGVDYHRQLILKALETDADIVVSKFVVYGVEKNTFSLATYGNYAIEDIDLKGEDILLDLFNTEFESSHRWLVWNKVYKKSLWDKSYPDLIKLDTHLIMLEDIVYGIIFMSHANRYVSCYEDTYFYAKHPNSSGGAIGGKEKLFKNLNDQINALSFIESFLKKYETTKKLTHKLQYIRKKQKITWAYKLEHEFNLTLADKTKAYELLDNIYSGSIDKVLGCDYSFFYRNHTQWDRRYENLKKMILNPDIEVVSFDIFDTLILRPFLRPTDLFNLLNHKWDELVKTQSLHSFAKFRAKAELQARKEKYSNGKRNEDITIDEIYEKMSSITNISTNICNILKEQEKKLEIKFCTVRKKLKEVFDLAIFLGKKVICITDMYLDRNTITKILEKNGYNNIYRIFISGEERLSKSTGHLYTKVLQDLDIKPEKMLHIGDNWHSDIIKAKATKINTFFVPKAEDLFSNRIADLKNGKRRASFDNSIKQLPTGNMAEYLYERDYFGIRCMMGIVANKMFDHPFLPYEPDTDFNRNPYYVGYYALGMHMYGIVQWLLQISKTKSYKKIHFVARDGYLAMNIYKLLTKNNPHAPKINYLYMSRTAFIPLLILNDSDLYHLTEFAPFNGKSPNDYFNLLAPILILDPEIKRQYINHNILLDKIITSADEYKAFIDVMIKLSYSQEKVDKYRTTMKNYFSSIIHENEVMFDIAYSGRAQAILTSLLGYPVNAAYIHYNDDKIYEYSSRLGFQADCYYNYRPSISGNIREVIQSEPIGSCIAYKIDNDNVEPVFEDSKLTYHAKFVLNRIHQGAYDFVKDLQDIFEDYFQQLYYRDFELCFAHEYFLHYPKNQDMQMMSVISFEDDLGNGKGFDKLLSDLWWINLSRHRLKHNANVPYSLSPYNNIFNNTSQWKKAVYYTLFDRNSLKESIKNRLSNHPYLLNILSKGYAYTRSIYRFLFKKKLTTINKATSHYINTPLSTKEQHPGKILFEATSEYGILYSILLKLTVYRDKEAVLLISGWRRDRLYTLEKSNIFSNIYIGHELEIRNITNNLNNTLKNASENKYKELSKNLLQQFEDKNILDFSSFSKIIIQGNGMYLHYFLHSKNIPYIAYEEAGGLFSNPELLLSNINKSFPLIEKWLIKKYSVLDTNNPLCEKWYINQDAQVKPYNADRTVNLNPIMCLKSLSEEDRDKILKIFEVTKPAIYDKENGACLVLTYPLAARLNIEIEEQIEIYATLADIFSHGKPIYFKPHPDDKLDYSSISNIQIIKPNILSELIEYHIPHKIEYGISAMSTALNNLSYIPNKIYFNNSLLKYREELIKYYTIYKAIQHIQKTDYDIIGINAYDDLLTYLFSVQNYKSFNEKMSLHDKPVIFIIGSNTTNKQLIKLEKIIREKDYIFSLQKNDEYKTVSIKKSSIQGGYISNLNEEYIFINLKDKENSLNFTFQCTSLNLIITVQENN